MNILEWKSGSDVERISEEGVKSAQINDPVIDPSYDIHLHDKPKLFKTRKQLVLPEEFQHLIFTELYQKMGHFGPDRVEDLCR